MLQNKLNESSTSRSETHESVQIWLMRKWVNEIQFLPHIAQIWLVFQKLKDHLWGVEQKCSAQFTVYEIVEIEELFSNECNQSESKQFITI